MKAKQLLILVAVAIVLGGVAIFTAKDRAAGTPSRTGERIFTDLDLNQVVQVDISSGGSTTTVARVGEEWIVPSKFGYPADFKKFREAMLLISELKIGSLLELNAEQKQSLKLTRTAATIITFKQADGSALADLMVGATRERKQLPDSPYGSLPDGRFVSIDGGQTAILISESLQQIRATPMDWIDAELASIDGPALQSVRVAGPDIETIEMSRGEEAGSELTLTNLAQGEAFDPAKRYAIESALSYLRLNDIADPALTDAELGMDKPVTFEARTTAGELYIARIGSSPAGSSDRFARFSVAYVGQDDGAAAVEEPATNADSEARAAAQQLNERLSKWTYIIPANSADAMTKGRRALLKELTTPPDPSEPPPVAAPVPAPASAEAPEPAPAPMPVQLPATPLSTPPVQQVEPPQAEEKGITAPLAPETAPAAQEELKD